MVYSRKVKIVVKISIWKTMIKSKNIVKKYEKRQIFTQKTKDKHLNYRLIVNTRIEKYKSVKSRSKSSWFEDKLGIDNSL